MLSGMPAIGSVDKNNNCKLVIDNCAPYDVDIDRNDIKGLTEQLQLLEDSVISAIDSKLPKVPQKKLSKDEIATNSHLNVPNEYKQKYIDILYKHLKAIFAKKYDLGLATNLKHKIHIVDNNPVYQKQFKISEADQTLIEQSLEEWLKLGVIKCSNSLCNLPIFCIS